MMVSFFRKGNSISPSGQYIMQIYIKIPYARIPDTRARSFFSSEQFESYKIIYARAYSQAENLLFVGGRTKRIQNARFKIQNYLLCLQ